MNALDWAGWKATGARNRLVDRLWETRLGIETGGKLENPRLDANRYETFAYSSIRKILARLSVGPDDVVADVGCGKGRVVCCAALTPARKVVGIDIDAGLCARARANAARLRGRAAPVEVYALPAQEFDYRECTALVLFNPFGAATMELFLRSLADSLRARPRALRAAYVNPLHESVLARTPGFERYDRWDRAPWSGLKQNVSFWRAGTAPA